MKGFGQTKRSELVWLGESFEGYLKVGKCIDLAVVGDHDVAVELIQERSVVAHGDNSALKPVESML